MISLTFEYDLTTIFHNLMANIEQQQVTPANLNELKRLKGKVEALKAENIAKTPWWAFKRERVRIESLEKEFNEALANLQFFKSSIQMKIEAARYRISMPHLQTTDNQTSAFKEFTQEYCQDAPNSIFHSNNLPNAMTHIEQIIAVCKQYQAHQTIKNLYIREMNNLNSNLTANQKKYLEVNLDKFITTFMKEKDIEIAVNTLAISLELLYTELFHNTLDPDKKKSLYLLLSLRALAYPNYVQRIIFTYLPSNMNIQVENLITSVRFDSRAFYQRLVDLKARLAEISL